MANGINIGLNSISGIKIGTADVDAVYIGTNLVYRSWNGKFRATYASGETYSLSCDTSTTITFAETQPTGYTASAMTSAEIGSCVTSLGASIFLGCSNLSAVTLPNTITSIDQRAFEGCSSLTSVTISTGVTTIGLSAFQDCSNLTNISIPSGVTSIENDAFLRCSGLTSITVDATTPPTLGNRVFDYTNDAPIYVPCDYLNDYLADWSDYSSRIMCPPIYRTASGNTFCSGTTGYDKYVNIYSQVSYDGGSTWTTTATTPTLVQINSTDCGYVMPARIRATYTGGRVYTAQCTSHSFSTLQHYEITQDFTGYDIGEMTDIVIGDCVTSFQRWLFDGAAVLSSITISNTVTTIGNFAFGNCYSLSGLTIPDSVTSIGGGAFQDCYSLSALTIPSSVSTIGFGAFTRLEGCQSVTFESPTVFTIEGAPFYEWYPPVIYVPSESLAAYKAKGIQWYIEGVDTYPDINTWIQPIPNS
jgi:hypothetical protein